MSMKKRTQSAILNLQVTESLFWDRIPWTVYVFLDLTDEIGPCYPNC